MTEEIQAENVPTEVIIDKQEKDTEKPLGGVEFTVWREKNSTQEEDLNKEKQEEGGDGPWKYVTDENGRIRLRGLHPGKYCIQETGGLAGYMTDSRIYEVTIDESGRIDGKEGVTLTIENARTQITDTRAFWKENRSKTAVCGEENEIIDLVRLKKSAAWNRVYAQGCIDGPEYRTETFGRWRESYSGEEFYCRRI